MIKFLPKMTLKKMAIMVCATATISGISTAAMAEERYCREFTSDYKIGGQIQQGYGTACLTPDGSWEIVSQNAPQPSTVPAQEPVAYTPVAAPAPTTYYAPTRVVETYRPTTTQVVTYVPTPPVRYVERSYTPSPAYLVGQFLQTFRYLDRKNDRKKYRHAHYDDHRRDHDRDRYKRRDDRRKGDHGGRDRGHHGGRGYYKEVRY